MTKLMMNITITITINRESECFKIFIFSIPFRPVFFSHIFSYALCNSSVIVEEVEIENAMIAIPDPDRELLGHSK